MATISPVSDLKNYNSVLENVSVGSPVYPTVNGRGNIPFAIFPMMKNLRKQRQCCA